MSIRFGAHGIPPAGNAYPSGSEDQPSLVLEVPQDKTRVIFLGSRQPILHEVFGLICVMTVSENSHQGHGDGVHAERRDDEVAREDVYARVTLSRYLITDTIE